MKTQRGAPAKMNTSNDQEVNDAAEALVSVLKAVSLEVMDSFTNQKQQQRNMDILVESQGNSVKLAREISIASKENFDQKMNEVNQFLASINEAQSTMKESFKHTHETTKVSNESFNAKMKVVDQHLAFIRDEIKTNFAISQAMKASNHDMNAKIYIMNQRLSCVQSNMEKVRTLLESQEKQRRLEFQASCADLDSFSYYFVNASEKYHSSDLVRYILKRFALEQSCRINVHLTTHASSDSMQGRIDFSRRLKYQLTSIMGHSPGFRKLDDDWFLYSYEF